MLIFAFKTYAGIVVGKRVYMFTGFWNNLTLWYDIDLSEEKDEVHRKLDAPVTFAALKHTEEGDDASIWLTKKDENKFVSFNSVCSLRFFS